MRSLILLAPCTLVFVCGFHLRIPAPHPECLGKSPSQRRNAALGADDSFPATGTCPLLLLREWAAGRVAEPSHPPRHAAKTPWISDGSAVLVNFPLPASPPACLSPCQPLPLPAHPCQP